MNLILAQLLKEQDDYKTNPTYEMGVALPQIAMQGALSPHSNLNPWEMLLVGALGGLGGGILQGIGQNMGQQSLNEKTTGIADLLGAETEAERLLALETNPQLKQYGELFKIDDALDRREATEAAKLEKLKRIQKILNNEVPPTDYMTPQGITVQKVPTYDYETDTFGEREVGRSMSPGQKKMAEALAEKQAGNVAYGGPFDPEKAAALEDSARKEIKGGVPADQFLKSEIAFQSMLKAYNDKSGLSDVPLLYGSVQTTEPGLAVRTDDVSIRRGAMGLGGVFADAVGFLESGQKFTKEMRAQLIKNAADARDARIALYKQDVDNARGIAERRKVNPDNVQPFPIPKESKALMEQTFGGELWQDPSGKNWIIHKDANGTPIAKEEL